MVVLDGARKVGNALDQSRGERLEDWKNVGARLKDQLARSGKSIYQLSKDSGIDAAYIWRVVNSEKREVSR